MENYVLCCYICNYTEPTSQFKLTKPVKATVWDGQDGNILIASAEEGVVRYSDGYHGHCYTVHTGNLIAELIPKCIQLSFHRQWLPILIYLGMVLY